MVTTAEAAVAAIAYCRATGAPGHEPQVSAAQLVWPIHNPSQAAEVRAAIEHILGPHEREFLLDDDAARKLHDITETTGVTLTD